MKIFGARAARFALPALALAALSLAPQAALAQHGGGGGHAGGGGGHAGGGHASSSGGGSHASSSSSGSHAASTSTNSSSHAAARAASSSGAHSSMHVYFGSPSRSATFVARMAANGTVPGGAIPSAQRVIPYHVTIGFPPRATETSVGSTGGAAAPSAGPLGGTWDTSHATALAGAPAGAHAQPLSFNGVGNELWSEPASGAAPQHGGGHASAPMAAVPVAASHPAAPVSVPRASAPAPAAPAMQHPAGVHVATDSPRGASSSPFGPARTAPRSPRHPHQPVGIFPIYPGYPIYGGFGYGGLGLWWLPWYGFDYDNGYYMDDANPCAPMWFEGCDAYDSGASYSVYGAEDSGDMDALPGGSEDGMGNGSAEGAPDSSNATGTAQTDDENPNGVWVEPPKVTAREQQKIDAEKFLTVLYLKDGSVYAVKDFWVASGKLTYDTSYGGENSIDISELDLEATAKANAARGVPFTLKPKPDAQPAPGATPQTQPQPPATPQTQPQD